MRLDDWFLTREERGNPSSTIDRHNCSPAAWTEGNLVRVLVDGADYFSRLAEVCSHLTHEDQVRFTDWRSDSDELLADNGPSLADLLSNLARRGIDVRGLLWRSHSDRIAFSAKENRRFADQINQAGGEVLLDERVRRGGSHHQKMVIVRHPSQPNRDVGFVGGIDLSHGRRDSSIHLGDSQSVKLDGRYGKSPPWHDVQLEISGPALVDLEHTFRERWDDPTPLNHAGMARAWISKLSSRDRTASSLPTELPDSPIVGAHAVQVLRTYPSRRPNYIFAPRGERSVARAFQKAVERARSLIYIEDQYFWSVDAATILARALNRHRELQLIIVVPRFPDKDGRLSGPPSRMAQARALAIVQSAAPNRVGIYNVENRIGNPIYVHAKVCVIDDVWATVGSDNLNRRSWTHDSELSCAVIDSRFDSRAPLDPGGLGDRSRTFARDLRMTLWAEHLGRSVGDPQLLAIESSYDLWQQTAHAYEHSQRNSIHAEQRLGRIRAHTTEPVSAANQRWATVAYRLIFDPDGRPLKLRRRDQF